MNIHRTKYTCLIVFNDKSDTDCVEPLVRNGAPISGITDAALEIPEAPWMPTPPQHGPSATLWKHGWPTTSGNQHERFPEPSKLSSSLVSCGVVPINRATSVISSDHSSHDAWIRESLGYYWAVHGHIQHHQLDLLSIGESPS